MTTELATTAPISLIESLAGEVGLEPAKFYGAVRQMCGCDGATDEAFMALLMQAKKLDLDPIAKQLYLMRTQKGVQVVIPVDGYLRMMIRHPDYVNHTIEERDDPNGVPISGTITIWTRDQVAAGLPPFQHTEYFAECRGRSKPWQSHPHRMLKHKVVSQGVRYRFAIYLPDPDEYERAAEIGSGSLPEKASGLTSLTESLREGPGSEEVAEDSGGMLPPDPAPYDVDESRRLDAEDAESGKLFE